MFGSQSKQHRRGVEHFSRILLDWLWQIPCFPTQLIKILSLPFLAWEYMYSNMLCPFLRLCPICFSVQVGKSFFVSLQWIYVTLQVLPKCQFKKRSSLKLVSFLDWLDHVKHILYGLETKKRHFFSKARKREDIKERHKRQIKDFTFPWLSSLPK